MASVYGGAKYVFASGADNVQKGAASLAKLCGLSARLREPVPANGVSVDDGAKSMQVDAAKAAPS